MSGTKPIPQAVATILPMMGSNSDGYSGPEYNLNACIPRAEICNSGFLAKVKPSSPAGASRAQFPTRISENLS